MPSKKNINQLENLTKSFSRAKAIYFTEYHGLNVRDITELRGEFFKQDVEYKVAKNSLIGLAANENKIEGIEEFLKGSTALAISYEEPVSPAKVIKKFSSDRDLPRVKGIIFDGKVLPGEDFKKLADLPSKDELLSKFANQLRSPIQKLLYGLNNPMQKLVGALNNLKMKKN